MKPEPLKGKECPRCGNSQPDNHCHYARNDVRAAVEWLKGEWKTTWKLGKQQEKLIDEAFEDVNKK